MHTKSTSKDDFFVHSPRGGRSEAEPGAARAEGNAQKFHISLVIINKNRIFAILFSGQMDEKQFIIRLNGLAVGSHLYEFEVDDTFFEGREYSEIEGAKVKVDLEVVKQNTIIQLNFTLKGTIHSACDRCTKSFAVEVDAYEEMLLKHGEPDEDHPENVLVIPYGENEVDISQPLYEFISLALPPRRVPCEDDAGFECDYDTLEKLDEFSTEEPEQNPGDTIWDKLKNIDKNNLN